MSMENYIDPEMFSTITTSKNEYEEPILILIEGEIIVSYQNFTNKNNNDECSNNNGNEQNYYLLNKPIQDRIRLPLEMLTTIKVVGNNSSAYYAILYPTIAKTFNEFGNSDSTIIQQLSKTHSLIVR